MKICETPKISTFTNSRDCQAEFRVRGDISRNLSIYQNADTRERGSALKDAPTSPTCHNLLLSNFSNSSVQYSCVISLSSPLTDHSCVSSESTRLLLLHFRSEISQLCHLSCPHRCASSESAPLLLTHCEKKLNIFKSQSNCSFHWPVTYL